MERFTEEDLAEMVLRLAHGIRNPLATIKTGIQLVQHLTEPTGDVAGYLNSALKEVARIDMIVKDMQRFVRMENQTFQLIEIESAIASAMSDCRELARRTGTKVIVRKGPKCRTFVDGGQLIQAIGELLANAIEFSVEDRSVKLTWDRSVEGMVSIHVDDSCPGMTDADRERMKRPFYSSSTRGTGLGLNIVGRFCSLCGGSLDWLDGPSGGCRFTLMLPEFRDAAVSDR